MAARDSHEVKRITDAETLKALTHPLRLRLLGLLRLGGPATATELARRLGESSGSTSYHLRQLERFGFIEEDPEQPSGRERRWRAIHRWTAWNAGDLMGDPEALDVSQMLERRGLIRQVELYDRWIQERSGMDPSWLQVAGASDDVLQLTPSQAKRLTDDMAALWRRYLADPPPPERDDEVPAYAYLHFQLLPFQELPL